MHSAARATHLTRDGLLKLLSDDEVASVNLAETSALLAEGDEYLDLAHLDKGVRLAKGKTTKTGRVLPKIAVQAATWSKLLLQLASPTGLDAPGGP